MRFGRITSLVAGVWMVVTGCTPHAPRRDHPGSGGHGEAGAGGSSAGAGGSSAGAGGSSAGAGGSGGNAGAPPSGFVHADGTHLVDAAGERVFLQGVSLGNQVWSDAAVPDDHGAIDFQRLADMGANSTRFLLNYVTFEDDSAPFVYKDAGFAWIDRNLEWARAHGIYLILNMHVPEGGFQSNGDGGALWSDTANQDRLTALWTAIASRYAGEPAIAAFDLLNEPQPLAGRAEWQALAARLLAAIRSVDTQHLVIVERTNAVAGDYGNDSDMNLFTLADPNVAYEFHFYDPTDFTFQLQPWNHTPDGGSYPDPARLAGVTEMWLNRATFDAPSAPPGSSDFTYYEGTRITADSPDIVVGKPTLVGQALGAGTVAFDELSIREFDPSGVYTREIEHIEPTSDTGWYFWSKDGSGSAGTTQDCKASATCLTLTGTGDDASYGGYGFYFAPKPGYQYSLSGWMKGTDLPAAARAQLRIDLLGSSTPVSARDKAGLATIMGRYLDWGDARGVPLFLGEFGVYKACFDDDKGGLRWVEDVFDLATGDGSDGPRVAALSYHQYHEDAFALYYGSSGPVDPANANQPLIDLLTAKFHAAR